MQRKGVPGIDGCLCEIKEKLKALYDRTHACILRINGKTPDGNGDITLDLSDAIPGRYVESVNGQDGNVIIDKASVGLSNVDNISSSQILNQADANNQSRLEAFEAAKLDPVELEVVNNSARIIQLEGQQVVLDDKMEQTIQYVDAIGDDVAEIKDAYVDKTTTQYITGKKYGPTPTSADYSGMWVNKDFVETTDPARRQNNLVHTIADETVKGTKMGDCSTATTASVIGVAGWTSDARTASNFTQSSGNRYWRVTPIAFTDGKPLLAFNIQYNVGRDEFIFTMISTKRDGTTSFKVLGTMNRDTGAWQ